MEKTVQDRVHVSIEGGAVICPLCKEQYGFCDTMAGTAFTCECGTQIVAINHEVIERFLNIFRVKPKIAQQEKAD